MLFKQKNSKTTDSVSQEDEHGRKQRKPNKRGIDVLTLCDIKTGYIYRHTAYTGKEGRLVGRLGEKVVCGLLQGMERKGYQGYRCVRPEPTSFERLLPQYITYSLYMARFTENEYSSGTEIFSLQKISWITAGIYRTLIGLPRGVTGMIYVYISPGVFAPVATCALATKGAMLWTRVTGYRNHRSKVSPA